MSTIAQKILVVGGNGFIGSAVCRAALAKGMQVTSVSSSGRPYTTPKGHSPAWSSKVTWLKGSAFEPSTFSHLLPEVTAVVHTLGTLIEGGGYKAALNQGNLPKVITELMSGVLGGSSNPLEQEQDNLRSYKSMNRDAALRVCEAFVKSGEGKTYPSPRPFVYLSAEDIGRPVIPAGYIENKREAEAGIEVLVNSEQAKQQYRGVYIRPSLVYHAHYRPLTTPAAVLLDLSATIHAKLPPGFPTPANVVRSFGGILPTSPSSQSILPPAVDSIANAMKIPPVHVDHVAEAICVVIQNSDVRGVVGVDRMREL